jgi:hypothetical protein
MYMLAFVEWVQEVDGSRDGGCDMEKGKFKVEVEPVTIWGYDLITHPKIIRNTCTKTRRAGPSA